MSILADQNHAVAVGRRHDGMGRHLSHNRMIQYGTKVVAGVHARQGGKSHLTSRIFDSAAEAARTTGANASAAFVPPDRAAGAMIRSDRSGDAASSSRLRNASPCSTRSASARRWLVLGRGFVGPNPQRRVGARRPAKSASWQRGPRASRNDWRGVAIGIIDERSHQPAHGRRPRPIRRRSGSGRPSVHGMSFADRLKLVLFADPHTEVVVLIGEIGGTEEQQAADLHSRRRCEEARRSVGRREHAPRDDAWATQARWFKMRLPTPPARLRRCGMRARSSRPVRILSE